MQIVETCCCGASMTAAGFTGDDDVIKQAVQFRKAHEICRKRPKINIGSVDKDCIDELVKAMRGEDDAETG